MLIFFLSLLFIKIDITFYILNIYTEIIKYSFYLCIYIELNENFNSLYILRNN